MQNKGEAEKWLLAEIERYYTLPDFGGAAAVKRALKQNRRLAAILKLKARLEKEKTVTWEGYKFAISADDRVIYSWLGYDSESWSRMNCKESRFDKFLGV